MTDSSSTSSPTGTAGSTDGLAAWRRVAEAARRVVENPDGAALYALEVALDALDELEGRSPVGHGPQPGETGD